MLDAKKRIYGITIAALLCAVGILIPIVSPIKIPLGFTTFTLASHVAIFIAMFISPLTAVFVSIGTTIGFFLAGFPPVVVARAATHIVFAIIGSIILRRKPTILGSFWKATGLSFFLAIVHALCEVIVVIPFFMYDLDPQAGFMNSLITLVLLPVGVGTIVHSMVDFYIAYIIWRPIKKSTSAKTVAE